MIRTVNLRCLLLWCCYIGFLQAYIQQVVHRQAARWLDSHHPQHHPQHHHSQIPPLTTTPPLRILLIVEPTPFNYVSGYANRFKEMLKYLSKGGDIVEVVTTDPDPMPPKTFLNFNIHTARGISLPMYSSVAVSFDFRARIKKVVQAFKPDVIHVSTPSAVIIPALFWAKVLNVPIVMSYHTDFIGYTRTYLPFLGLSRGAAFLVKQFHEAADMVLCTSPQLKQQMTDLGLKRVDVWQKGINTEIFSPKYRSEEVRSWLTNGHPEAPLLLYVGRLGAEKRIHRLRTVLKRNPSARLALVGTGPAEETLKKEFQDLPVVFTGQIVGEKLSQIFASADIFVMPSDTETLGFVVLEALASGVPVVGAAAGGLVDIIEHDNTGYLAEACEDMNEFSQYVTNLVQDKQLRSRMGLASLNYAQQWSWEAATSKLRNIQYRKALALHRSKDESGRYIPDIVDTIMHTDYKF
eukprot:gene7823-8635_t